MFYQYLDSSTRQRQIYEDLCKEHGTYFIFTKATHYSINTIIKRKLNALKRSVKRRSFWIEIIYQPFSPIIRFM